MSLTSLDIQHFRNLHSVKIKPDASLNIISGSNAAGKTSLLESLFYLSYGRSFRSSQTRDLIEYEEDYFRLIATARHHNDDHLIGIQKSTKEQIIRVNKQTITRVSDLAALLPLIALHPDSHYLISAGPEFRRQYMDWGVFHVEHAFIQIWKRYRKALSQRNAALRNRQSDKLCVLWDSVLVESALEIDGLRHDYLQKLTVLIQNYSAFLFPQNTVTVDYKRGWPEDLDYQACLSDNLARDKEKGFTQSGPHRADIRIRLDNKSAQNSISRGQQKKLVTLLKLAQLELFLNDTDRRCVLLYDDLPAELDAENRHALMTILSDMNVQLFVSAIDVKQLDISSWCSAKMFHVEQGQINEMMV